MRDSTMTRDEKLFDIFFRHFNSDNSKFLIPRLPYSDRFKHRRVMDYAIISHDPSTPRVAILIRPENGYRSELGEIELENALRALKQLEWIPLVFTYHDFEVRSEYVREQLEMIFSRRKASSRAKVKRSLFSWFNKAIPA